MLDELVAITAAWHREDNYHATSNGSINGIKMPAAPPAAPDSDDRAATSGAEYGSEVKRKGAAKDEL